MSFELWSWMLTGAGMLTAWLAGNGGQKAWVCGLCCQTLWVTYAVTTSQLGFIGSAMLYSAVYVRNLARDRRGTTKSRDLDSDTAPARATAGGVDRRGRR